MANSGCTSEALKHKFSWRSEKMTTEYVSGSHAALIANAKALTCGVEGGEPVNSFGVHNLRFSSHLISSQV